MSALEIFLNNDNEIIVDGVRFADGEYINDGTVTVKIKKINEGSESDTIVFEDQMEYEEGTNGRYRLKVPYDHQLEIDKYRFVLRIEDSFRVGQFNGRIQVKQRTLEDI